jgi:hypothetical protein
MEHAGKRGPVLSVRHRFWTEVALGGGKFQYRKGFRANARCGKGCGGRDGMRLPPRVKSCYSALDVKLLRMQRGIAPEQDVLAHEVLKIVQPAGIV